MDVSMKKLYAGCYLFPDRIIDKGGVAFLKVRANIINKNLNFFQGILTWEDHIIVLLGGLSINTGTLSGGITHFTFNYFTWGRDGWMMYINEDRFEDGFYGMIYAYWNIVYILIYIYKKDRKANFPAFLHFKLNSGMY
jgi:hypothetical protein